VGARIQTQAKQSPVLEQFDDNGVAEVKGSEPSAFKTAQIADGLTAKSLKRLKFGDDSGFQTALRRKVDAYFQSTGKPRRDCWRMYLKTALILAWTASSYALLVFVASTWWLSLALALSLGLSLAAIGFNIQHDGGHGAYSKRPWLNKLMAYSLDLLGGSSYMWAFKHNIVHHTYPNITGYDDDINLGIFGRVSPHAKRFGFHRFQHLYLWLLYGFLPLKWHLYDDFHDVAVARIGGYTCSRPRGWDLAGFIGGKVVFFSLAIGLPIFFHPVWLVLLVYVGISFVQGIALSVVFQLPHCVEAAGFPMPHEETDRIENAWAAHQVETTVNYATNNRLLSWFVGGLNFQIEHHLFPHICHIHYAALAPLVADTCQEFGLQYNVNHTFRGALASHFRWLKQMGKA
jgi:linoleoyl-CoA desaturase